MRSGIVADLRVAPQQTAAVVLPLDPETLPADGELLLNVEYRLKDVEPLLAPDHRVAYQQFTLRAAAPNRSPSPNAWPTATIRSARSRSATTTATT